MKTKTVNFFALTLLASALNIAPVNAAYVMHIPTEVARGGALVDNSIKFVTPTDEPEIDEPETPKYKGTAQFSVVYESTQTVKFKSVLTGYTFHDYTSNNTELPNLNPDENPCVWNDFFQECVQVIDNTAKGYYYAIFSGDTTVVTYTYNTQNKFPNQIEPKTFKTSYNTLYIEQKGEMVACSKSAETFKAVTGSYAYDQYLLAFTCPVKLVLPLKNFTINYN